MKNLAILLFTVLMFNACIELPDLIPNNNNGVSDMVVVEYDEPIFELANPLVVDNNLTIEGFVDVELGGCGNWKIRVLNGQILKPNSFSENEFSWIQGNTYSGLTPGQLMGEAVFDAAWQSSFFLSISTDFVLNCLTVESLTAEQDVYLGIRFRIDNVWHYGWLKYFVDADDVIILKSVAYNINPGVNVRIGG